MPDIGVDRFIIYLFHPSRREVMQWDGYRLIQSAETKQIWGFNSLRQI